MIYSGKRLCRGDCSGAASVGCLVWYPHYRVVFYRLLFKRVMFVQTMTLWYLTCSGRYWPTPITGLFFCGFPCELWYSGCKTAYQRPCGGTLEPCPPYSAQALVHSVDMLSRSRSDEQGISPWHPYISCVAGTTDHVPRPKPLPLRNE